VAAGLGGPGRLRYGGVRDFVIGCSFVDGRGTLVRAGARVVKNAAGFDLPKLLVGSLGRLGVLAELTFKVFPRPQASATLEVALGSLEDAVLAAERLLTAPLELAALEMEPQPQGALLSVRVAGMEDHLAPRLARLEKLAGSGAILLGEADAARWRSSAECEWAAGSGLLVRVAGTLARVAELERETAGIAPMRRYGCGGAAAWLAAPAEDGPQLAAELDAVLRRLGLRGLVVRAPAEWRAEWPAGRPAGRPLLGVCPDEPFRRRVASALDPDGRFAPY
jgi:glycolate oxidase FAD binding subunit